MQCGDPSFFVDSGSPRILYHYETGSKLRHSLLHSPGGGTILSGGLRAVVTVIRDRNCQLDFFFKAHGQVINWESWQP